jgi:hypothetical protein
VVEASVAVADAADLLDEEVDGYLESVLLEGVLTWAGFVGDMSPTVFGVITSVGRGGALSVKVELDTP